MANLVTTAKELLSPESWSCWSPDIQTLLEKSWAAGFCMFQQGIIQELGKPVFCTKKKKQAVFVNRTLKENTEPHPKNYISYIHKQCRQTLLCTVAVGNQTKVIWRSGKVLWFLQTSNTSQSCLCTSREEHTMWPEETGVQAQVLGTRSVYAQVPEGSLCSYEHLHWLYWDLILNCPRGTKWGPLCPRYLCECSVSSPVLICVYMYICVSYVFSTCLCLLGILAQPHYLVGPGLGSVAVLSLSQCQTQPCYLTRKPQEQILRGNRC